MANYITKENSAIALAIIAIISSIGGFVLEDNQYYCDAEHSIMTCDSLSGGAGTRCYLNAEKTSWDYCSSGWVDVSNYVETSPEAESIKSVNAGATQERCSSQGCVPI